MRRSAKNPLGYTLIELMLVITIIGLLASLAIPNFQGFLVRARAAERTGAVNDMAHVMLEAASRKGAFPQDFGALSIINAPINPPVINGKLRPFTPNLGDWRSVEWAPDGWVRVSYAVFGFMIPGVSGQLIIDAYSDLDGDGIIGQYEKVYQFDPRTSMWTPLDPVAPFSTEGMSPPGEN